MVLVTNKLVRDFAACHMPLVKFFFFFTFCTIGGWPLSDIWAGGLYGLPEMNGYKKLNTGLWILAQFWRLISSPFCQKFC